MRWQWIGLVSLSLTLLPAGLALTADRVPHRLRVRLARVRLYGCGVLLMYSTAPLNAVPRLAEVSPDVTLICSAAGSVLCVAGMLLTGIASNRRPDRAVDGPRTAG